MHHDEKLKDKLVRYIEDAYAMENQIVQTLQRHVEQAKDFPTVQQRIREHLAATEQHMRQMEARLKAYGKSPSGVKGALSGFMGTTAGAASGTQPDTLVMNARDEYVTEHFEIAAYTLLITAARAYGDEDTVRACELNLRDEIDMQSFLAQHLAEAALLTLQQDGITVPRTAWDFARLAQTSGVQAMFPTTDLRSVTPAM
jgi:ferritin-like metal-binding protein YciE